MPTVESPYFSGHLEASQDNSIDRMIGYGEQVNKVLAKTPLDGKQSIRRGTTELRLVLGVNLVERPAPAKLEDDHRELTKATGAAFLG